MLDFIVSPTGHYGASGEYPVRASIPDRASYAFFTRYFQDARLDWSDDNFLGYWGGTDLSGYQLVRLRQVLDDAVSDLSARPQNFRIFSGWSGQAKKQENEIWKEVDRDVLIEITRGIVSAIELACSTTDRIEAVGD